MNRGRTLSSRKTDTAGSEQMEAERDVPTRKGIPAGYGAFLKDIKARIRIAQVRAGLAANAELILLYWRIGADLIERQREDGWGSSVIKRLASDIQKAFPGIKGFSTTNIWRMRAFYLAYAGQAGNLPRLVGEVETTGANAKLPQAVGEIDKYRTPELITRLPWGHNVALVEQMKEPRLRFWYAAKAIEHGWSRSILEMQIESELHRRQGTAVTNFNLTLPPPQSDMAQQTLKDPYLFDFLTLADDAREKETERALLAHVRDFMLELGQGFAFVGSQVNLKVGDDDFYIDLLFYHLKLRCFVVIDLKTRPFMPEYAGKMNFYLSAVDDRLRHPDDKPSIGLILCKRKLGNKLVLEYALRDFKKPIGISQYRLTRALPKDFKPSLPTVEAIEAELSKRKPS